MQGNKKGSQVKGKKTPTVQTTCIPNVGLEVNENYLKLPL